MAGNIFGKFYRLTSFGESHGAAIGGVIEGCPAGYEISEEYIQEELNRRRPGSSPLTSTRKEPDRVEILSGIFEGKTTGMPIGFIVRNENQRSEDYEKMKSLYRPSHADYTWSVKYQNRDYRGGGRASAREHIARVVGGAVARQILDHLRIGIVGYISAIGDIAMKYRGFGLSQKELAKVEESAVRCPDAKLSEDMAKLIESVRKEGDSIGGIVNCVITGLPVGLGEPVFDRFQARLAAAMMSINAAKGFEYGSGFGCASMRGSEHNDIFISKDGRITTETNRSGGIQGGVTNGEEVYFRVAFKPTATIMKEQRTVDSDGNSVTFKGEGRHDPCVAIRAVPVVEAMAAMVVLDSILEADYGLTAL